MFAITPIAKGLGDMVECIARGLKYLHQQTLIVSRAHILLFVLGFSCAEMLQESRV